MTDLGDQLSALRLLADLRARGLTVAAGDGGKLLVSPAALLNAGTREELRQHKDALLAALTGAGAVLAPELVTDEERWMLAMLAAGAWSWWRPGLAAEWLGRRAGPKEQADATDDGD